MRPWILTPDICHSSHTQLIQNRPKLAAIIHNARQCVAIDQAFAGGLSAYLWNIVADDSKTSPFQVALGSAEAFHVHENSVNPYQDCRSEQYHSLYGERSAFADELVARLKRSGKHKLSEPKFEPFKFLGALTVQAFMLQCGLLNGHSCACFKNPRSNSYKLAERHEPIPQSPSPSERKGYDAKTFVDRAAKRQRRSNDDTVSNSACSSIDDVWL